MLPTVKRETSIGFSGFSISLIWSTGSGISLIWSSGSGISIIWSSGSGISLIWSSGFGISKRNHGEIRDWKYVQKVGCQNNPRDHGIAQSFRLGLRDWRTLLRTLWKCSKDRIYARTGAPPETKNLPLGVAKRKMRKPTNPHLTQWQIHSIVICLSVESGL